MATLPISAADLVEFRPNSTAVKAAREALEKAQATVNAVLTDGGGGPDLVTDEMKTAVAAAQKALDEAEEARAKADPAFLLKVPTGRTNALVDYDVNADPDVPRRVAMKTVMGDILAEAEEAGADDDALAAVRTARELSDAGKSIVGDAWKAFQDVALETPTGRRVIAGYMLTSELEARHRLRRHLVLDGRKRNVLSETDLNNPKVKPYLGAINAELVRLSTLTEDDAKNSDAP